MKYLNIRYCLIYTILLMVFITPLSTVSARDLLEGEGTVDRIDYAEMIMVADDSYFQVGENVRVHSEFVRDDYFKRIKEGRKIKYTYSQNPEDNTLTIREIWILRR